MSISKIKVEIEQIKGPQEFLSFPEYLKNNNCPHNMLPYPHEFILLLNKYKKEANGLGVVIFKKNGQIIGFAPYIQREYKQNIRFGEKVIYRFRYNATQILRPNSSQWGNSLEVPQHLLLFLFKEKPEYAIRATEMEVGSKLYNAFQNIRITHYLLLNNRSHVHCFHYFSTSYDTFFRKISSKYRNQIRRKEKKIIEKVESKLKLKEYVTEESVPAFLTAANSISIKTYQARLLGEVVENSAENKRLLGLYAKYGYFRSFILWVDQLPISFLLGFQTPDGIYDHAIMGYDPHWREYSPGFNCNILLLKRLYEHNTPRLLDFGGGDSDMKRLMSNQRRESISPILCPKTPHGIALYSLATITESANRWIVSLLNKTEIAKKIKQWIRK